MQAERPGARRRSASSTIVLAFAAACAGSCAGATPRTAPTEEHAIGDYERREVCSTCLSERLSEGRARIPTRSAWVVDEVPGTVRVVESPVSELLGPTGVHAHLWHRIEERAIVNGEPRHAESRRSPWANEVVRGLWASPGVREVVRRHLDSGMRTVPELESVLRFEATEATPSPGERTTYEEWHAWLSSMPEWNPARGEGAPRRLSR